MTYKVYSTWTQTRIATAQDLKQAVKLGKEYAHLTDHGFWVVCDGKEVYRSLAGHGQQESN